ncbi:hypothetical protein [Parabacteroides sp. FAFU027]|uniref:hypothetical protein n=1 Tax=Parabacteroides sp. FAFU027 TaxID=2922715 RepID=UPI001FAECC73|nr:hypothetical protein [Parabacteroides sp. FAFU027]
MKDIEMIQKLSVLHCILQMIASADGGFNEERDQDAIDVTLKELDLPPGFSLNGALRLNPYDCFVHLNSLNDQDREAFHQLMHKIAGMAGDTEVRMNCANYLLGLCVRK